MVFGDVSAEVLQSMIACMLFSKENRKGLHAMKLFQHLRTEHVLEMLDFSNRLLMPWAGVCCAQAAIEDSRDAQVLLQIIAQSDKFAETEEASSWERVLAKAIQRVALVIEDAVVSPHFDKISANILEEITDQVDDGVWSNSTTFSVPCKRESDNLSFTSQTNNQGFSLNASNVKIVAEKIPVQARISRQAFPNALKIAGSRTSRITWQIMREEDEGLTMLAKQHAMTSKFTKITDMIAGKGVANVDAGSVQEDDHISFKTKMSRISRQCAALVAFCAARCGLDAKEVNIEDAWRYFRDSAQENLADILGTYLRSFFHMIHRTHPELFRTLSCDELASIISKDDLSTHGCEVRVLQAVIEWSMHKSRTKSGFDIGDEVCVKPDSKHVAWRGANCIVKAVTEAHGRLEIQRMRSRSAKTLEIEQDQVYDAAESGFVRLLEHVRCVYIPIEDLRTKLSFEQTMYASRMQCYRDMVQTIIQVTADIQTPSSLTERGRPRHGYKEFNADKNIKVLTNMLLLPSALVPPRVSLPQKDAGKHCGDNMTSLMHSTGAVEAQESRGGSGHSLSKITHQSVSSSSKDTPATAPTAATAATAPTAATAATAPTAATPATAPTAATAATAPTAATAAQGPKLRPRQRQNYSEMYLDTDSDEDDYPVWSRSKRQRLGRY